MKEEPFGTTELFNTEQTDWRYRYSCYRCMLSQPVGLIISTSIRWPSPSCCHISGCFYFW